MTIPERLELMATIVGAGRCQVLAGPCRGCMAIARGFMHDIRDHVAHVVGCEPTAVSRWALAAGVEPIEEVPHGQA